MREKREDCFITEVGRGENRLSSKTGANEAEKRGRTTFPQGKGPRSLSTKARTQRTSVKKERKNREGRKSNRKRKESPQEHASAKPPSFDDVSKLKRKGVSPLGGKNGSKAQKRGKGWAFARGGGKNDRVFSQNDLGREEKGIFTFTKRTTKGIRWGKDFQGEGRRGSQ